MPKLIIPNLLIWPARMLWVTEPDDILLLNEIPDNNFIKYVCDIKNTSLNSFHILPILKSNLSLERLSASDVLEEAMIAELKKIIQLPHEWTLYPIMLNSTMIKLMDKLGMTVSKKLRILDQTHILEQLNDKKFFRSIALKKGILHAKGLICESEIGLKNAFLKYIPITGQLIVKQRYNGGGFGNIGVGINNNFFYGVHKVYLLKNNEDMIAKEIWHTYIDDQNKNLIVEVYYPNSGTISAIMEIDQDINQIKLLNTTRILYEEIFTNQSILSSVIMGAWQPALNTSVATMMDLISGSYLLAEYIKELGYHGLMSCDVIQLNDQSALFTEINVRCGGETHINYLLSKLFGSENVNKIMNVSSSISCHKITFTHLLDLLKKNDLSFQLETRQGIIILVFNNDAHTKTEIEYLVIGDSPTTIIGMQKKFLEKLHTI